MPPVYFIDEEGGRIVAVSAASASRVTLQHVADELGVSAKTVSNAFTRPDQLSAPLRERVLATAARLGYPGPNPLAAGLRRGRVGAIGVAYANGLSYAFDDPVAVDLLAGISAVAEPAGVGLLLVPGSADPERAAAAIGGALIDGLIVSSLADDDPLLAAAIARRIPLAVVDQPAPARLAQLGAPDAPWVGIDDRAAAATLAEHLLALGHRQLAVVCFGLRRHPPTGMADTTAQAQVSYAVTRNRLAGYRDAATRARIDWSRIPVWAGTDSTPAVGEAAATAVLAITPRPTALLCLSDRLAEGALRAAASLNLRVPEDVSIAGFDNATTAVALGLTTVAQPTHRKGELAARAVLNRPQTTTPDPGPELLPTQLVIRSSTGPAPSSRSRSAEFP
jgi:DNA-binding LacI/PurR family transcriptional regulator